VPQWSTLGISLRNGWLVTDKGWMPYFCEEAGCRTHFGHEHAHKA
jgi:hypothetical protein